MSTIYLLLRSVYISISKSNTPYLHLTDVQHVVFLLTISRIWTGFVLIDEHLFPLDTTREHDNILDTGMLFILLMVNGSLRGQTFDVDFLFVDKDIVTVMAGYCKKTSLKQTNKKHVI